MMCDPCFMDANQVGYVHELTWDEIKEVLDNAVTIKPRRQLSVQFSGGEPTMHPRFVDAVRYAREKGYNSVQAATNGIEFAKSKDFCKRAFEAGLRYAYLQFDGIGNDANSHRQVGNLFDVKLPDRDESYQESFSMFPGDDPVTVDTPAGTVGLSICYDVRFPELYRRLVADGACLFTVPAAFTRVTGEAHWHTLLRARAIENLAYVIAPGQCGRHPDGRETFGHSLIVDPWGRILAERVDGEGVVAADMDPALPPRLRSEFPALANRRL
jgi:hypothetical protein